MGKRIPRGEPTPEQREAWNREYKAIEGIAARTAVKRWKQGSCFSVDELIQEGVMGAWCRLPAFDPGRGLKLSTFMEARIRGAILDFERSNDETTNRTHTYKVKVTSLSHEATDSQRRFGYDGCIEPVSNQAQAEIDYRNGLEGLEELIRPLLPLEKTVFRLRFIEDKTMYEIGNLVGLSESRISQMFSACFKQIAARANKSRGNVRQRLPGISHDRHPRPVVASP